MDNRKKYIESEQCKHKKTEKKYSFRQNFSHGKKSRSRIYGDPKKITIVCKTCSKKISRYKP